MSGEAVAAVADVTAAAVETAVAEATAVTAAAVAGTEVALAVAEERIERAEATAEAITEAALQSEIGRRVEAARQEFDQWRGELRTMLLTAQDQIASLQSRLEAHMSDMTIHTPILAVPVATEPSISPPSAEVTTVLPATIVDPLAAPVPTQVENVVQGNNATRRKRLL
jgi:hypothetical protein